MEDKLLALQAEVELTKVKLLQMLEAYRDQDSISLLNHMFSSAAGTGSNLQDNASSTALSPVKTPSLKAGEPILAQSGVFNGSEASDPQTPKLSRLLSTPARNPPVRSDFGGQKASREWRIGFLYSSPLVEMIERKDRLQYSLLETDSYNFNAQATEYKRILEKNISKLTVTKECVSLDQLIKSLEKQPKIVHLSCHGGRDNGDRECFLYFENQKLELQRITVTVLDNSLRQLDMSKTKIMILSAPFCDVLLRKARNSSGTSSAKECTRSFGSTQNIPLTVSI